MEQILALRPFIPARDYALSRRFYAALGFAETHTDDQVTLLKRESFSFILQNFHHKEAAENTMVQLLVRDADAFWRTVVEPADLPTHFAVAPPRPPTMQPWGLKVGFLFDPSGILWHIAEAPF